MTDVATMAMEVYQPLLRSQIGVQFWRQSTTLASSTSLLVAGVGQRHATNPTAVGNGGSLEE